MNEEIIRIGSRSYGKTFDEYWNRIINLEQENKQLKEKIDNISSIVEYWGYDKEINDISYFRKAMKSIKEILGDKE